MTLHLLVIGRTGQVATELQSLAGPDLQVTALGREDADLAAPENCASVIEAAGADVIINAAAYTDVDGAEADEALATRINAEAPGVMARAASARGLPFLHISTDYVFDGSKPGPWVEGDSPAPLGAYGRSKLAGEQAVADAGGEYLILRTAWVFSSHGRNFVRTMLRVGAESESLNVVDDQHGGPTAAADIAKALVTAARAFQQGRGRSGIFHYAGAPAVSWCGFAREIFARADWMRTPKIQPIRTEDWPTPAARPRNSVLDCSRIEETFGIPQPDWRVSLDHVMVELRPAEPQAE
ncbi:MAG TPA: dTDP-4-dehydrorhamnose reductase [Paracoccaceae bacterium]|nr:dTDP-4-dehydrorhamnose reductase [Paracoccaceae bacterium]